ncbi:unnamed protein product [Danaus chrysippus]|uniref:(African queen) hypothetical protein n=1 Tax=Danaus chrysippus TaxID=151541 RepID=A0A8J2MI98_9NEOP|nr:unnamed protein product [Danaus chrysippus]
MCYSSISKCIEENETAKITGPKDIGRQEAITLYRNKGSGIDLSNIHNPLLTNITAEKVLGVAPMSNETIPWNNIKRLIVPQDNVKASNLIENNNAELKEDAKKSKRDVSKQPVQIERGAAVIPSEAGVHSIGLPPLIAFNKNLSKIPVPIPNMSVVSYAKVNTLVHSP